MLICGALRTQICENLWMKTQNPKTHGTRRISAESFRAFREFLWFQNGFALLLQTANCLKVRIQSSTDQANFACSFY